MADTHDESGFYGNGTDLFYVSPSGRTFLVAAENDDGSQDPIELAQRPSGLEMADDFVPPGQRADYLRRVARVSGEALATDGGGVIDGNG